MAVFALILIIVGSVILLTIPILIGVYVYHDASRRGMNAALWTLMVLFLSFAGFTIYLLERRKYTDWQCPTCFAPVSKQYVVCPKCDTKIRAACSSCGYAAETGWMACPHCTSPLPEQFNDIVAPIRKKDTTLVKILALAAIIPALIMLLGIISPTLSSSSGAGSQYLSISDYQERPEVNAWLNKCNEDTSKTYALRYQTKNGDLKETHYLVYRPTDSGFDSIDTADDSGLFSAYLDVKFRESPGPSPLTYELLYTHFFHSGYFTSNYATLRVFVNDIQIDCEITDVDYNPGLFYIPFPIK